MLSDCTGDMTMWRNLDDFLSDEYVDYVEDDLPSVSETTINEKEVKFMAKFQAKPIKFNVKY